MRVCQKHMVKASESLKSLKTGEEFDLCPQCEIELREILNGKPADEPAEPQRNYGPGRPAGRTKKKVA